MLLVLKFPCWRMSHLTRCVPRSYAVCLYSSICRVTLQILRSSTEDIVWGITAGSFCHVTFSKQPCNANFSSLSSCALCDYITPSTLQNVSRRSSMLCQAYFSWKRHSWLTLVQIPYHCHVSILTWTLHIITCVAFITAESTPGGWSTHSRGSMLHCLLYIAQCRLKS